MLRVTHRSSSMDVHACQSVIVAKCEWVQYSSPQPDDAEYIAVCIPAFSPDTVRRDS